MIYGKYMGISEKKFDHSTGVVSVSCFSQALLCTNKTDEDVPFSAVNGKLETKGQSIKL